MTPDTAPGVSWTDVSHSSTGALIDCVWYTVLYCNDPMRREVRLEFVHLPSYRKSADGLIAMKRITSAIEEEA